MFGVRASYQIWHNETERIFCLLEHITVVRNVFRCVTVTHW